MLLLTMLSLVLGGALLAVAVVPAPAGSDTGPSDATLAEALAVAVALGQDTIVESAGQAALARVLNGASPAAAIVDRARGVLDSLAASLGDPKGSVVLLDAAGRTVLARGGGGRGSEPMPLPAGDWDLARVLALRDGALIASTGVAGRTVVFAVPVDDARGNAVGALGAAVPVSALLDGPPLAEGATTMGSAAGAAWTAIGAPGGPALPLPRPVLFLLAALSLLAVPLARWAGRPPTRRAEMAAVATVAAARESTPSPMSLPVPATRALAYASPGSAAVAHLTPAWSATVPIAAPMSAVAREWVPGAAAPDTAPPITTPAAAATSVMAPSPGAGATPRKAGWFGRGRRQPATVAAPLLVATPAAEVGAPPAEEANDTLCGLGSQRGFGEELDRLMVGWERNHVPFALLMLDVDDLRITNSRAGHAAGDEQLRALGRQVRGLLRFSDRAFRIGGDEFAVLLPHTDAAGAAHLGQRLLAKTRSGAGGEPVITFSGGAAAFPGDARDRDELMAAAAAALAWAKGHGRASILAYDPVTHTTETDADRVEKETAVATVIREKSLRAVFQPIVDMATGDVVGYEGLTRPGPGAPFTNPGLLFEAAERAGRTVELDAACFETIAEAARAIPRDRVVSINLSPRTMEAADFSVPGVLAVLASHDLDPGRVILELTERETVLDLDRLRDNLSELQRAGVRIAADDVGAGNAGLRLLSQFRFDIVKVDLSLVQEGANNDASQAVLRSLRDLAQRWGAFVIAEGIETAAQLRVVRELGLAAGQGFLIGRPGTIVDLPPVDLVGLEEGHLMLQNAPAPAPAGHAFASGSPA